MAEREALRFDASYSEEVPLADGTTAVLRTVRPSDAALFRRGFDQFSDESRYFRFFSAKLSLSDAEIRYLTEVDGYDHFALGALREVRGVQEGVGVARFVRDLDDTTVAEPAIAVVDAVHNLGLGTVLLHRLVEAAAERGIARFQCEVLAGNAAMRHLIETLSPEASFTATGPGVLLADLPLPSAEPAQVEQSAIQTLMGYVARQVVSIPLGRRLLRQLRAAERASAVLKGGDDSP